MYLILQKLAEGESVAPDCRRYNSDFLLIESPCGRVIVLKPLLSGELNSSGMSSTRIKEMKVSFPL